MEQDQSQGGPPASEATTAVPLSPRKLPKILERKSLSSSSSSSAAVSDVSMAKGVMPVKGITPLISAAGGKFVPVKFPIQIIRPQSGAAATAAGSSGVQAQLRPRLITPASGQPQAGQGKSIILASLRPPAPTSPSSSSSSAAKPGILTATGVKRVVTMTPQQLLEAQLKNPGATGKVIKVVGGAQKELINKMLKSSSEPGPGGGGSGGSTPNILRAAGSAAGGWSGAGVTAVAIPASALVAATAPSSPRPLQQSAADTVPSVETSMSSSSVKTTITAAPSSSSSRRKAPLNPTPITCETVSISSKGGTTTLSIVNGKIVGHRSSSSNDDDDEDEEEEEEVPTREKSGGKIQISAPKIKCDLAKGEKFLDVSEEQQTLDLAELLEPLSPDDSVAQDCDKENLEDCTVKWSTNEFNAFEVFHKAARQEMQDLSCKEVTPESPGNGGSPGKQRDASSSSSLSSATPTSPANSNFGAPAVPSLRPDADVLLNCAGCGMYGMRGEFHDAISCSAECADRVRSRRREREKRERELAARELRRETKRREKRKEEEEVRERLAVKVKAEQQERQQNIDVEEVKSRRFLAEEEEEFDEDEDGEHIGSQNMGSFNRSYYWYDANKGFSWARYLECMSAKAAPARAFAQPPLPQMPFPATPASRFACGMKLEAIDPEKPALICAVSVVDVLGARLRLHFDGFSDAHDFWENADSPSIFPIGWCQAHGQPLQPPKGYGASAVGIGGAGFSWKRYLDATGAVAAPRECFPHTSQKLPDLGPSWRVGMKLEAVDKLSAGLVCVASVSNVMAGRVLVHFDGWEIDYDYWVVPATSPYIHHAGWCKENGIELNPPKGYPPHRLFSWPSYLAETASRAVPASAFKAVPIHSAFKKGQKIEVVDRRNPILVRVATIQDVLLRQIKIHYDGWPDEYDLWVEDSYTGVHPPTWCFRTKHPLMPPLTPEEVSHFGALAAASSPGGSGRCPTPGCRSIGHFQGPKFSSHSSARDCPYALDNMNKDNAVPDRVQTTAPPPQPEEQQPVSRHGAYVSSSSSLLQPLFHHHHGGGGRKRMRHFDGSEDFLYANKRPRAEPAVELELDVAAPKIVTSSIRSSVFRPQYHPNPAAYPGTKPIAWKENSDFLAQKLTHLNRENFKDLSPVGLSNLVATFPGLDPMVARKIADQDIDGEAFLMLTQKDIIATLGVRLGPALKLIAAAMIVKSKSPQPRSKNWRWMSS